MSPDLVPLGAWRVASTAVGLVTHPDELDASDLDWVAMSVPGTAAGALRAAGRWTDESATDFDCDDWWFTTTFSAAIPGPIELRFAGLATIADVWLNGAALLHSEDMFVEQSVSAVALAENTLTIVCRSLRNHLAARRARPRWKTRLVEMQQLRWVRTTLLGRMPTWPPTAAPVGPWRAVEVRLASDAHLAQPHLTSVAVQTTMDDGRAVVRFVGCFEGPDAPVQANLVVGGSSGEMTIVPTDLGWSLSGVLTVEGARGWFPATHGEPELYDVNVRIITTDAVEFGVGRVGFRRVAVDTTKGSFGLSINGQQIFCRGACWVPLDPVGLTATRDELEQALRQVAAAGMNMVRITGTSVPEQDEFYEICDHLGIMVWHDLMFANMDYPIGEVAFALLVATEVAQLLDRLRSHPSVVVICGGSEVEQQAAMMGIAASSFENTLGRVVLAEQVARDLPAVQYVPCSPSGGTFPFSVSTGISHYYGVGAYLRPLGDARAANVRFTTECLAFANVGTRQSVEEFLRDGERPGHAPRWKARVPRDRGAGWDFEDVRDHYVASILGVDPAAVRYADSDRYLDLGRAAVCIAIESALGEWRRPASPCDGALVFTLRDLADGPGWGLIDATGRPKSAYYSAARLCRPTTVLLTDEGLNGLVAHVLNDPAASFDGYLRARLFGLDGTLFATAEVPMVVPEHGAIEQSVDGMFAEFRDLTYAFRFGPQLYDAISVQLSDSEGRVVAEAFSLPGGHARAVRADIGLSASARVVDNQVELRVTTQQFAQFVSISAPWWTPADDWFHLAPGDERTVLCAPQRDGARFTGEIRALNSHQVVSLGCAM